MPNFAYSATVPGSVGSREERRSNFVRRGRPNCSRRTGLVSELVIDQCPDRHWRHTGPLARTDVAKHRDYCMRIERSRLFEAVFLLEPHKACLVCGPITPSS